MGRFVHIVRYASLLVLPKDHCHRFLIGTASDRWHSQRITDDFESFILNWDGESTHLVELISDSANPSALLMRQSLNSS